MICTDDLIDHRDAENEVIDARLSTRALIAASQPVLDDLHTQLREAESLLVQLEQGE